MTLIPIRLNEIGEAARFGAWFVEIGDPVREGERIAEVLIPGVAIDVLSPASGTLSEKWAVPRQILEKDSVLGLLKTDH